MRITLLLALSLCSFVVIRAQQVQIIPQPVSLTVKEGSFSISRNTPIVLQDEADRKSADFLNLYLRQVYGFVLPVKKGTAKNAIRLFTRKFIKAPEKDAYNLEAGPTGISIEGDTYAGTFYGIQTLIQLLPVNKASVLKVAAVAVQDAPRFTYRGMMLDAGRHFFPVSFIKKYLDYLALHKFNKFHWHLTDDQGWRIEIKKYPKLTSVGGWRNGTIIGRYPGTGNDNKRYGGFYTQAQIREIVKYAGERYIDVVPEIEMPGHASAAIAAYPELSCFPEEPTKKYYPKACAWGGDSTGKQVVQSWGVYDDVFVPSENTFKFLENVLDEVMALFPYQYIHIGGDECPKTNWKRSAFCQQLIKERDLKDEHGLQSYFIQRIEKYINGKGRKIIGWDEILEGGLAPNASVMSWRGEEGGIAAARDNHNVVMTPTSWLYLDYSQSENEDSVTIGGYVTVQKTYGYEPVPAVLNEEQAKYVLGAQGNLWTEYIEYPSKVEYMVFPRMTALSEVVWSPKEKRNWDDFEQRLRTQFKRYDLWKAHYSNAYFDLKSTVLPAVDNNGLQMKLETKQGDAQVFYKIHDSNSAWTVKPTGGERYMNPFPITANGTITSWMVVNGAVKGKVITQNIIVNKATGKKILLTYPAAKNYPGDGPFTLVNGIQNEKGLARSKEFLGFEGQDCEAVLDLGSTTPINEIIVHTYEQQGSWIYFPGGINIAQSEDGQTFTPLQSAVSITKAADKTKATITLEKAVNTRYLKITILNAGVIPDGMPGAGHKAWLFVDELELK